MWQPGHRQAGCCSDSRPQRLNAPVGWALMSYEHVVSEIVKVVEAVGAGIMVIGGLGSCVVFASRARHAHTAQGSYDELRRNLAAASCWASRS